MQQWKAVFLKCDLLITITDKIMLNVQNNDS